MSSSNASQEPTTTGTSTTGNNAGQEDYLDKGLDSVEKKYGGSMGADTQKNRGVNEKITDGARGMFEKATGKDVPDKHHPGSHAAGAGAGGLKARWHRLDEKWQRCRPYIERMNGTMEPLEHQGLLPQQEK
ncbi:hypothetical protein N0V83_008159 [Neocucurbitaria cava]|uniref:Uncharacterized protein n=1 Tax=Neocucurbitaria cava TaxID=798079 RepID=A0A9W9CIH3_9PLEO|nr:hypothetical protein N0V83_008159 [Neocucurbitaria cava]